METYESNIIDKEQASMRVDKLLPELNSDWFRNQIQDRIKVGLVVVSDRVVKSNYKVKFNSHIVIIEKEVVETDILSENLNLDIYYEDDDVAVVYKPKGTIAHPLPEHYTNTLVNSLAYQIENLSGINGEIRPDIVYRIDMNTFGLLMAAKGGTAHRELVE